MDDQTLLEHIKIRLGIPLEEIKQDALLQIKVTDAENYFLNYCNRSDIPETAAPLIEQLAVSFFEDKKGVLSEKVGDTSYSYASATVSDELRKQLNRYRLVKVI